MAVSRSGRFYKVLSLSVKQNYCTEADTAPNCHPAIILTNRTLPIQMGSAPEKALPSQAPLYRVVFMRPVPAKER